MKSNCHTTSELLPWLLNGSLEAGERAAVLAHLAACDSCRGELEATEQVWELATGHVPSLALAEYAQGLTPGGMDVESIERHLGSCASCRQELEWAAGDAGDDAGRDDGTVRENVLEFERPAARREDVQRRESWWRHAALAAGLAAVVSSAGLIWSLRDGDRPGDPAYTADRGVSTSPERLAGGRADTDAVPTDHGSTMALFSNGFEEGDIVWSGSQNTARNTAESSNNEPRTTQKRRRI
jgi:predicted anti-sigma-YlaC factor YlaD